MSEAENDGVVRAPAPTGEKAGPSMSAQGHGWPPENGDLLESAVPDSKPTQVPLGDTKGFVAPSVPASLEADEAVHGASIERAFALVDNHPTVGCYRQIAPAWD